MSTAQPFAPSFALFDAQGRLLDWNCGFAQEFSDATDILAVGLPSAAILDASLLPQRALDLGWAAHTPPPEPLHYLNKRRAVLVTQTRSATGAIVRWAQRGGDAPPLHPDISQPSAELLRSGTLQMSAAILARRRQEEDALRAARAAAEDANHRLRSALQFNEAVLLNSPLPMAVYAATGRCVQANEAYAGLIGLPRSDVLLQNFHHIEAWQAADLLASCQLALHTQEPQMRQCQLSTAHGKDVFTEVRILPTPLNDAPHLLVQFIDLTEHKLLEDQLRHYAFHDTLTRLPNRRLLQDRLERALRYSQRSRSHMAVLFLDLDKFKQLNDTHGHDVGDLLLVEVARRLKRSVRDIDTVARLGGDEFVVLLEGLDTDAAQATEAAHAIANKIRYALSADYLLGDLPYQGGASVGVKLISAQDTDPDQIMREADALMYKDKKNNR